MTASDPATEDRRREAFDLYVVPELDVMYRVALSITRNRADAEDLVQDALVRAYRAVDRFDGRYPRAWLLTIVRNTQINRTRRRRPELLRDPDDAQRIGERPDPNGIEPEAVVVDPVFDAAVVAALEALPDRFREPVELVDIAGMSYAEAAEAMGVPIGTVMSRLHRARKRMRTHIEKEGRP